MKSVIGFDKVVNILHRNSAPTEVRLDKHYLFYHGECFFSLNGKSMTSLYKNNFFFYQ